MSFHAIEDPTEPEDETQDPTEPDEEDWVTSDYQTFYQHPLGKPRFTVPGEILEAMHPRRAERQPWVLAIRARMEADRFWPNVWFLGERGDWNLLDITTGGYAR